MADLLPDRPSKPPGSRREAAKKLQRSLDAVPDGEVFDGSHPRLQQLELLLELYPAAPAGELDAVVEHRREGLTLQRPAAGSVNSAGGSACRMA